MPTLLASQWHEAARLAATLGKPGPMSAAQREQQREAYVAAVDGMATQVRILTDQMRSRSEMEHALHKAHKDMAARYEQFRIEYAQHVGWHDQQASSFWARLRWLLTGR